MAHSTAGYYGFNIVRKIVGCMSRRIAANFSTGLVSCTKAYIMANKAVDLHVALQQ